jgi:hypothetical protein
MKNIKKTQRKSLRKRKKVLLLHPQQRRRSSKYWQERRIWRKEIFKKKDSKKLARFENAFYICTPQNTESSLRDWEENWRKRD